MIGSISLALFTGIHILTLQRFTEGLDLFHQTVIGHHQSEVKTGLRFLILARQQVKDHPTTEAYHGSTLTISILYVVDVFGCFYTFGFYPLFDSFAQTRGVNQTRIRSQTGHGFLNLGFILC